MIQSTLTGLKDYILSTNTYFGKGFDDVYMDETTGIVANGGAIFPNDTLGDYFYLRLPNQSRFDYAAINRVTDCSNTPGVVSDITLVACVRKASADRLMTNLLNTISSYNDDVRFVTCQYRSEDVVLRELGRLKKENIEAALQRLGNHTIVSVNFSLSVSFQLRKVSSGCILDPCKC
jgi:hypothetical protein